MNEEHRNIALRHDEQCSCGVKSEWQWNGLDGRGTVLFRAALISGCGLFTYWSCEHRHHTRDDAQICADKERVKLRLFPKELDNSTVGEYTGSRS